MNLRDTLAKAFYLRSGEGWPFGLLAGYSFLSGISLAYFISLANASFLSEFGTGYLPHGYIVTGLVGYIAGLLLARFQRQLPYIKLPRLIVLLLLVLTLVYRLGLWAMPSRWLTFGMFVTIGLFTSFINYIFTSLATRLFDLRQSKRLLSLASAGNVVSSIIGFFSVPLFLRLFGNPADLLLIVAASLILCVMVLNATTRRFAPQFSTQQSEKKEQAESGFAELLKNRYFVLIFLLTAAWVLVFYYVDYTFLAQLRIRYQDQAILAKFIGFFYGIIKIVELIIKTSLARRLMTQYGLRFGLMVLPVLLLMCNGLATLSGLLGAAGMVLFSLMALSKLIERAVWKALYIPSFTILYQPLSPGLRLPIQTKVDLMIQPLAVGLAGATLLFFSWVGSFNLVLGMLVAILVGWIIACLLMNREYRATLMQNLETQLEGGEGASGKDTSSVDLLREQLKNPHPAKIIYTLKLLTKMEPSSTEAFMLELLEHPNPEVRQEILRRIGRMSCIAALDAVRKYVDAEPSPQVRDVAVQTLEVLHEAVGTSPSSERLAELADSSAVPERILAVRMLDENPASGDPRLLEELMQDENAVVRRAALTAAGKAGNPQLWETIIEYLSSPAFCNASASALTAIGEPVLPALESSFSRALQSSPTMRRIVHIYGKIGGDQVRTLLTGKLNFPDESVHWEVLNSLRLCGYQTQDDETSRTAAIIIGQQIDEVIDNLAWNIAALLDISGHEQLAPLKAALGSEIDQNREQVFLLLFLLYDARSIQLVRDNFKSGGRNGKVYALELLDVFVSQDLKELLFPLLDDLSLGQRLRQFEQRFPQQHLDLLERLKGIINHDYTKMSRWTKACALHALPAAAPDRVVDELIANLFNPDPLLRETGAWAIYSTDPAAYEWHVKRLPDDSRRELDGTIKAIQSGDRNGRKPTLGIEKVFSLKKSDLFSHISETILAELVPFFDEVAVESGDIIPPEETDGKLYIIIQGGVQVRKGEEESALLGEGDALGEIASPEVDDPPDSITATEPTRLFSIDQHVFCSFIADHIEAARGIVHVINPPSLEADAAEIGEL